MSVEGVNGIGSISLLSQSQAPVYICSLGMSHVTSRSERLSHFSNNSSYRSIPQYCDHPGYSSTMQQFIHDMQYEAMSLHMCFFCSLKRAEFLASVENYMNFLNL